MRLFIRNAVFLVTLCVVLKFGLYLGHTAHVSPVVALLGGVTVGGMAGALAFFFLHRRRLRGMREMSYSRAKTIARQMVAQEAMVAKQQNKEQSAHGELLWWFTFTE